MQSVNLAFVIAQAQGEARDDAIGTAVRNSIEVGVVVPSILRQELAAAGLTYAADEASLADYGFASTAVLKRVLITKADGDVLAMGAAGDRDEALLAAVLGWFREHPLPDAEVPAGFAVAPSN